MIKLDDIIANVAKEDGFYIFYNSHAYEFIDADDFYESEECEKMLSKIVCFIYSLNDRVAIIIRDN